MYISYCSPMLILDNSDSPSIVEQQSQKAGVVLFTLYCSSCLDLCPMPYAWIVASCSVGYLLSGLFLRPGVPLCSASCQDSQGFLQTLIHPEACGLPLYLGFPPVELWDSLSSLVNSGIACLTSQSSDWLDALWASLSSV